MKKHPTQTELAIKYQVNQPTISNLKKAGVDIYSQDEVRATILKQAKRPPAWSSGCPWDEKPEANPDTDIPVEDLDMERLRRDLLNAGDYDEARFIKTKLEGLKNFMQLSIIEGDHLPRSEVMSDHRRIAAGVSSGLDSLCHELPAVCEGLTAAQMKGKVKLKTDSIKRLLADETSELYQLIH